MDLEQFVSNTLTQIIRGIARAQADAKTTNAWINPMGRVLREHGASIPTESGLHSPSVHVRDVEFDVAVTVAGSKTGDLSAERSEIAAPASV